MEAEDEERLNDQPNFNHKPYQIAHIPRTGLQSIVRVYVPKIALFA